MEKRELFGHPGAALTAKLRVWHQKLLKDAKRGDRARLRRASTIEEAALTPEFYGLLRDLDLDPQDLEPTQLQGLAALGILAAWVDQDSQGRSLGKTLGAQPGSDKPVVSIPRFRRLLTSDDLEVRLETLRRLIFLVGKAVDLHEIAAVIFHWNSARQRQLAYDYYSTIPASK